MTFNQSLEGTSISWPRYAEQLIIANRSFDADAQRHCAARHAGEATLCSAMPLGTGQLQL
jgi:hypothetical protein